MSKKSQGIVIITIIVIVVGAFGLLMFANRTPLACTLSGDKTIEAQIEAMEKQDTWTMAVSTSPQNLLVTNNHLLIGDHQCNQVAYIDLESQTLIWKRSMASPSGVYLATDSQTVFVVSQDGHATINHLDLRTGESMWTNGDFPPRRGLDMSQNQVGDRYLYVNNTLIDVEDGTTVGAIEEFEALRTVNRLDEDEYWQVIDETFHVLSRRTQSLVWTYALLQPSLIYQVESNTNYIVIVTPFTLYVLDRDSGENILEPQYKGIRSNVVLQDDTLQFINDFGDVIAMNLASGESSPLFDEPIQICRDQLNTNWLGITHQWLVTYSECGEKLSVFSR